MIEQYKIEKKEKETNLSNEKPKIYFMETLGIKRDTGMTRIYSAISQTSFFSTANNKN